MFAGVSTLGVAVLQVGVPFLPVGSQAKSAPDFRIVLDYAQSVVPNLPPIYIKLLNIVSVIQKHGTYPAFKLHNLVYYYNTVHAV